MNNTKMIRVTSRGIVMTSRGRVISPILCPYKESISNIWTMITADRADVEEKLPDGTFIKLTAQNFDKDNFVSKEQTKPLVTPDVKSEPVSTFKNVDTKEVNKEVKDIPKKDSDVLTNTKESKKETVVEEVVEEGSTADETNESDDPTIVVNGEKRVDPRFNKKNKNKNRNNQNNNSNKSIAVEAEDVE